MSSVSDNETWIVERGALVIEKKADTGVTSLCVWERLVYCLWVADYMMRNAGGFANATDLYRISRRMLRALLMSWACR